MYSGVARAVAFAGAFLASLVIVALLVTLNGSYGAQKSDELVTRSTVQEITYGSTVENAVSERPEGTSGKCFLTMESGATHALKLSQCTVSEGDSISLLTSTDGGERLSPEYYAGEVLSIHMYLIVAGAVLLGSLFFLGLRAYYRKSMGISTAREQDETPTLELALEGSN